MTNQRLAGKRLLITGAASGIGRATALRVASGGANVALIDWDADGVAEVAEACTAKGARAMWWQCDVSDELNVSDVVARAEAFLGGLDVLVHIAGISRAQDVNVDDVTRELWDQVLSVNLTGTFNVIKHATAHLEQSRGAIIMTGSGAGVYGGHRSAPYAASKGGMNGLMLALEEPLRARGIRINNVAPGSVDTPMLRQHNDHARVDARRVARLTQAPGAIAAIMAFLASDSAAAVRGVVRTW